LKNVSLPVVFALQTKPIYYDEAAGFAWRRGWAGEGKPEK